jgi:hypothetical protein
MKERGLNREKRFAEEGWRKIGGIPTRVAPQRQFFMPSLRNMRANDLQNILKQPGFTF